MRPPAAAAFRLLFLLLLPSLPSLAADVRVTLPLEQYYRPGRYVPVRIEVCGAAAGATLRLTGDGMVPTQVAMASGRAAGVVPVLPLTDGLRQLRWSLEDETGIVDAPLRALEAGQRLVGFASVVDRTLAPKLFPELAVISVQVAPLDLTTTEPGLWQTLDAIVFSAGSLAATDVQSLAAAGVTVAGNSADIPQETRDWPWEQLDGARVLRPVLLGPARAGVFPAAFAPAQGWRADLPRAYRTRLLLYAVLIALLLLGAALLRGWFAVAAILSISLLATLALQAWWRGTSRVLERAGGVLALQDGAAQEDAWRYRTARTRVEDAFPGHPLTWPFLEQPEDLRATDLRLESTADGRTLSFRYRLAPGRRLAFLSRRLSFASAPFPTATPGESDMNRLAQRLYLRAGYSITGIVPATPDDAGPLTETYPVTVIRRDASGR